MKVQNILLVSLHTIIAWLGVGIYFYFFKDLPRTLFIITHYLADILSFGLVFLFYFKYFGDLSSFSVMAISMLSLFTYEFVFFNFITKQNFDYFNFIDYIVPAFLVASTIYLTGTATGN